MRSILITKTVSRFACRETTQLALTRLGDTLQQCWSNSSGLVAHRHGFSPVYTKRYFSSDSKTPPEDQPPGTASITFDETEDDSATPNEETHPPESLKGEVESYTVEVVVRMPDMGEGDNNKIETWYKKPGDIIKRNDILCDITTPDFTFGMVTEDEFDAIMGEIHVPEGQVAEDDAPICTILHQEQPGNKNKEEEQLD